jgi:sodium transport system permease protein
LHYREGDDTAKMGRRRVLRALDRWQVALKAARFRQAGLPPHFDEPVRVADPEDAKPPARRIIDELRDGLARAFPFVLFMWVLTGAIQPAIDMGAGEKERGTMETLLISPASRAEIVLGKFLAVSIFASVAGIWNLLFFGGGAVLVGLIWPDFVLMRPAGLFWCAALTPAVACLFAAVCLALGVYAKSTKEGQYYLMPMFLVVVPLIFLSMTPGVDLNLLTSFIPLTGAALLLQKFLAVSSEPPPLAYLAPVLLGLAGWAALALRWAVYQFSREEVLFREAERFELRLWLRSLFRRPEKPAGGG